MLAGAMEKPIEKMVEQVKTLMKSGEMPSQCRLAAPEFAEAVWMLGETLSMPSFQAFSLVMFFINSPDNLPPKTTDCQTFLEACSRADDRAGVAWGCGEVCSDAIVALHDRWSVAAERCLGLSVL